MLRGTYILHQSIMQKLLKLVLLKKRSTLNYQYKILNVSRLSLDRKINDQNLRNNSYHYLKNVLVRLY